MKNYTSAELEKIENDFNDEIAPAITYMVDKKNAHFFENFNTFKEYLSQYEKMSNEDKAAFEICLAIAINSKGLLSTVVEYMLESGVSVTCENAGKDYENNPLFSVSGYLKDDASAEERKVFDLIVAKVKDKPDGVDGRDQANRTALAKAVENLRFLNAGILFQNGADPTIFDDVIRGTPFEIACQKLADPNIPEKTKTSTFDNFIYPVLESYSKSEDPERKKNFDNILKIFRNTVTEEKFQRLVKENIVDRNLLEKLSGKMAIIGIKGEEGEESYLKKSPSKEFIPDNKRTINVNDPSDQRQ